MIAAHPLQWPDFIPRASRRESGRFSTTLPKALENVETSIRLFGSDSRKPVKDIVLSSNVTLGATRPSDPGVAAWFIWDGEQLCIPVDRYDKVESNLQAIHLIIEARRVELRHGSLALVKASFRGFKALPSNVNKPSWWQVLDVPATATKMQAKEAYRRLAATAHPDKGGDSAQMARVNDAWTQAEREAP